MTPLILVLVVAVVVAISGWVRLDGNPASRPQPRPQDDWSDLPTRPYAT